MWTTHSRRGRDARCCAGTPWSSSAQERGGCDEPTPDQGTMPSMRMLRPAGYPANRAAARWVFDLLVTLLAGASAVPELFHDSSHPGAAAIVVLALMAAPLLVRRIWPIPVFGWIVAVALAGGFWDRHLVAAPALLIALYTVASMRPRRDALACAGLLELAALIRLLLFAGTGWWYDAIFISGLVAAPPGLGLYSPPRRPHLAELHHPPERL